MSNFMHKLSSEPAHQAIPQLLAAIGGQLGQGELDKAQFLQAVKDLHGIVDELEVLTALHVVTAGADVQEVAEQAGFGDELIRTCWFIANPAPVQED